MSHTTSPSTRMTPCPEPAFVIVMGSGVDSDWAAAGETVATIHIKQHRLTINIRTHCFINAFSGRATPTSNRSYRIIADRPLFCGDRPRVALELALGAQANRHPFVKTVNNHDKYELQQAFAPNNTQQTKHAQAHQRQGCGFWDSGDDRGRFVGRSRSALCERNGHCLPGTGQRCKR